MRTLTVGYRESFAIESGISKALSRDSQLALGYFVIHVSGRQFGVRAPDATCLGCSRDEVARRIRERGQHVAPFERAAAPEVVEATCATLYDGRDNQTFFGLRAAQLGELMLSRDILWAPDGDEAFDDGGHVIQLDVGAQVRLIAFMNLSNRAERLASVTEQWLDSAQFYSALEEWLDSFDRLVMRC